MIKHNQDGGISGVTISLILTVIMLIAAIGFGAWAYTSRQDYKDNSDAKAKTVAEAAVKANSIKKDKEFAEEAKKPFKTYHGPSAFGSLNITYPKTWSAYIDVNETGGNSLVDAYFYPDVVPGIIDKTSVFALRAQVVNQSYDQALQVYKSLQQAGKVSIAAYALPKMPDVIGVRIDGEVSPGKKVSMVILPLRSESVKIWTEGDQFLNDFNNIILPEFSFVP